MANHGRKDLAFGWERGFRKMLNLQHHHNNHTTTSHMRVDPIHWGPPSYERLLCDCCDGVVYESNPGI
jgi:hypothetical protein